MAKRSKGKKKQKATQDDGSSEPNYPYTVVPKSLRRFLELVPQRPKPPKVTTSTLRTWGFKSGNDASILRVLKDLDLLSAAGEPTQNYNDFMKTATGAAALGRQIKKTYEGLFQNVSNPEKAPNEELRNFFNINSGGSETTIRLQVDTFKALAAYATFGGSDPLNLEDESGDSKGDSGFAERGPAIRIDLHIHLPENKSKSDYDAIMESIANHLYKSRK